MTIVVPIRFLPTSMSTFRNGTEQTINTELGELRFPRLSQPIAKLTLPANTSVGKINGVETCLGGRDDRISGADCDSPLAAVRSQIHSLPQVTP